MTVETPLTILLIEDNPGDVRYIQEVLRGATELSERTAESSSGVLTETYSEGESPVLLHEPRLSSGLDRIEREGVDVLLLDLNLPDSNGLETVTTVLDHAETLPVVVLTGLRDRETGMEALRRGADEYLVKDEINADVLTRSVYHAIERKAQERQLKRHREQLTALNQLNGIVQEITAAVLQQSTREEIERLVCERLAEADSYLFCWIGDVSPSKNLVTARIEAGVEGYVDDIEITYDDSETSRGPTGRAIQTKEMQVSHRVLDDPNYAPWYDHVEEYGVRSSAAIPITHDGILYGVLNVYSARPDAFRGQEGEVIGTLGEIVGHAIAAIERKEALMSDDVIEIEFEIQDIFESASVPRSETGTITLDRTISVGDGSYLTYGSADEKGRETLESVVEALPHWESVTELGTRGSLTRFEVRLNEPPVVTLVAAQGGRVRQAKIEDGDYLMTVHLPQGADVRRVVDGVQEAYPDARVIAQRQTARADDGDGNLSSALVDTLTERQRSTLESAFYAGFFEWPRESTGKEVAESLGISAPTFNQHMRAAERKIMTALFEGE